MKSLWLTRLCILLGLLLLFMGCNDKNMRARVRALDDTTLTEHLKRHPEKNKQTIIIRAELHRRKDSIVAEPLNSFDGIDKSSSTLAQQKPVRGQFTTVVETHNSAAVYSYKFNDDGSVIWSSYVTTTNPPSWSSEKIGNVRMGTYTGSYEVTERMVYVHMPEMSLGKTRALKRDGNDVLIGDQGDRFVR